MSKLSTELNINNCKYVTGNKYQNTFNDGNKNLTSPAVLWTVCEVVKFTKLLNNICQTDDDKIKEFMLLRNFIL